MKRQFLPFLLALALLLPLPVLGVEIEALDYEGAVAACFNEAGHTVEQTLEAANATAVLRWRTPYADLPELRDYELYLIGRWTGPRTVRRLLLPSTVAVDGQYPTDRAPDSIAFSEDGASLVYVYRFPQALFSADGGALHQAGTYTYRTDIATGELTVTHRPMTENTGFSDVSSADWFAPYVKVCVEEGLMKGIGGSFFAPDETLSDIECTVLALRLHDLGQGGDGVFDKAPDSWGYATLSLPDGTVREGYFDDGSVWGWTQLGRGDLGHFGIRLNTEEEKAWGRSMDYQSAVFSVNGKDLSGKMHLNGPGFLYFAPLEYSDVQDARFAPLPGAWWRDAWYYAEQNGLAGLTYDGSERRGFATQMAAVTDLPAINEIPGLPDTGDPDTLELYRAGVLTGSNEYGTFNGYSTMTRAEAAAICARILRPELRVSFTPKPLETYADYTLTYLRDDGERPGGPYRALHSTDLVVPDRHSLMNLDGMELPVPEGYEVVTIGDGLAGLAHYGPPGGSEPARYGLMDTEGQFRECSHQEVYENPLLGWFPYTTGELYNGYVSQGAFYDAQGRQVTPCFDWAGTIGPGGAGFVGMDRKIYRIQFEK